MTKTLAEQLRDPFLWERDNVEIRSQAADEIVALTKERHQLRNELTAARLEKDQLRAAIDKIAASCPSCGGHGFYPDPEGERIDCDYCAPLRAHLRPAVEPNLLSITEAELNAALLPVAKHMNAQLRQYWAMPPKEFAELAWNALIDEMGSEQTNVLYALCARLSPEWEREAEEGAKIDATPQKSGGGQ